MYSVFHVSLFLNPITCFNYIFIRLKNWFIFWFNILVFRLLWFCPERNRNSNHGNFQIHKFDLPVRFYLLKERPKELKIKWTYWKYIFRFVYENFFLIYRFFLSEVKIVSPFQRFPEVYMEERRRIQALWLVQTSLRTYLSRSLGWEMAGSAWERWDTENPQLP